MVSAPAAPTPTLRLPLAIARRFASFGCWRAEPGASVVDWAKSVHECWEELLALATGSSALMSVLCHSTRLAQRFAPLGCPNVEFGAPWVDWAEPLVEYLQEELAVATDPAAVESVLRLPVRIGERCLSFGRSKMALGAPAGAWPETKTKFPIHTQRRAAVGH